MADAPISTPRQPGPLIRSQESSAPSAPVASTESQPAGKSHIKAEHTGFDPLRPFRRLGAFIGGTVHDTFDKAAHWGRKGFFIGVAVGVLAFMVTGGGSFFLATVVECALGGLALGAGGGGLIGLLTGGMRGVGRSYRKEKYADELATREEMREEAIVRGPTYKDVQAHNDIATNYNYDRMRQTMQENQRDDRRYWQDRVDDERHPPHWSHGF